MLTSWQLAVLTVVWDRTKCGSIDLVRAHLSRYRTHIQHTRAIKYSYLSAVVPALLRRGTTVSRTPLVAASDSHTRCSHTHVPRPAPRPCRRPRATCARNTRASGGEISTNITRGSPHPGHGGARPRAPFTGVKPNIYEYKRTKCGSIDLVRAHLSRYRTHIQHTRAIKYSYLSAVVPALLRRGTTISRTPLVAASDSHTRYSHTHVPRPASSSVPTPRATCARTTRVPRAARYRQTSLADRHIQDTAAHDLVPLLLA